MEYLSKITALLTVISVVVVSIDLRRNPQQMKIMNAVWVLTAVWASIVGLLAYILLGRSCHNKMQMGGGMKMEGMEGMGGMEMGGEGKESKGAKVRGSSVVLSTLHCGAGCTLADIVGAIFVSIIPIAIGGSETFGSMVFDYTLALIIGIVFQYLAITQMGKVGFIAGMSRAIRADFLSLTAWQFGMYGWIFFNQYILGSGEYCSLGWDFWLNMQVAMGVGFVFALPINYLLIRSGIKSGM